ncbi:hypothetical protein R80B4_00785 [Fibrobacteres bacterium R8-0-B4]
MVRLPIGRPQFFAEFISDLSLGRSSRALEGLP